MSITLTITISDVDQPRLQAALGALGISDPAAFVAGRIVQVVHDYEGAVESSSLMAQYQAAMVGYGQAYKPIAPSVAVT